ncbi:cytochrome P450 [Auriculariales sp. MPI-PUGE-AT-0066]|nr:cytochrome P450 [Auriculariales sp. MPI-PUGE-AT-0066]
MFERETYIQRNLATFRTGAALSVLALAWAASSLPAKVLACVATGTTSLLVLVAVGFFIHRTRRFYLSSLPGPPSTSFLAGSELEYYHEEAAVVSMKWTKLYGPALKFKAALWGERLIVSDPRALNHITNTNAANYDRPAFGRALVMRLVGPGIVWAVKQTHQRHRKVLMPMYNGKHLRTALSIFQHYADALAEKWRSKLAGDGCGQLHVNMHREVTAAALDVLFTFSYDQNMGTIQDPGQKLAVAFRDLFISAFGQQTAYSIMVREILERVPHRVLRWVEAVTPNRQVQSSRASFEVAQEQAVKMIQERRKLRKAWSESTGTGRKDVLDALIESVENEPTLAGTPEGTAELVAQVATMAQAGQETTGSTTAFIIWELCNHPEWQTRLRNEIREMLSSKGHGQLDATDYDAMPVLQAVVRESLRYHPVCPKVDRAPYENDIIPLSEPVYLPDGSSVDSIQIAAGTVIHVDIASYNRRPDFFGADADVWNPARWLPGGTVSDAARPGVVGGMFTFIDGPRSCLGWKFAVLELSVIITAIIGEFECELEPGRNVIRGFGGVMGPLADHDWSGWNLPCIVKPAQEF